MIIFPFKDNGHYHSEGWYLVLIISIKSWPSKTYVDMLESFFAISCPLWISNFRVWFFSWTLIISINLFYTNMFNLKISDGNK